MTMIAANAVVASPVIGQDSVGLDVESIRRQFAILREAPCGKPLVYLDSAATSQKPRAAIDAIAEFYKKDNANVHEIVFTRGTTESINLVAETTAKTQLSQGDEVLVTEMEHYSNIVPWQMNCSERGARLRVALLDEFEALVGRKPNSWPSPRSRTCSAQSTPSAGAWKSRALMGFECWSRASGRYDTSTSTWPSWAVISKRCPGHKMYGPTGIGELYGRSKLLEEIPPYQGGSDMIASVSFEGTVYNKVTYMFEAGTPDVAAAVGLRADIDFVTGLGREVLADQEHDVLPTASKHSSKSAAFTSWGRPEPRPACFPSWSTAYTPMTSGRSSTARALPSALVITAPNPL
jgi:cysteine desulfurase/selenocysteine lyase